MDKLRQYGQLAWKYHFWIALAVVVLVAVGVNWQANSALEAATQSQQGVIGNSFSGVENLTREPVLPNDKFAPEYEKLTQQQKALNREAWQALFEPQAELLTWPDLGSSALREYYQSQQFQDFLQGKPNVDIPQATREMYRDNVHDTVARLYDVLNMVREVQQTREVRPGEEEVTTVRTGIVEWDDNDRQVLEQRFKWPVGHQLTSGAIRYAQEDYWIYEALLRLIAATNEGASDRYSAPITTLHSLAFAQRAFDMERRSPPRLVGVKADAVATAGAAIAVPRADSSEIELADRRYCDVDGKPAAAPPAGAPVVIPQKFVPVYLDLTIEQRQVPKFLTLCANAPVPLNILQLRVLAVGTPTGGKSVSSSTRTAAPAPAQGSGMGRALAGGGGMGRNLSGGGGAPAARPTSSAEELRPGDIHMVLRGVLCLYNPPPPPPPAPAAVAAVGSP